MEQEKAEREWATFFFESKLISISVNSREAWLEVCEVYKNRSQGYVLGAKLSQRKLDKEINNFGFKSKHKGRLTLGEWADRNGMNLDVEVKKNTKPLYKRVLTFLMMSFFIVLSLFIVIFLSFELELAVVRLDIFNFEYIFLGLILQIFGSQHFFLERYATGKLAQLTIRLFDLCAIFLSGMVIGWVGLNMSLGFEVLIVLVVIIIGVFLRDKYSSKDLKIFN